MELQHHIQECTEFLMQQGFSRADAVREAQRRFGDLRAYRSTCVTINRRRQRRVRMTEFTRSIVQDLRYALRGMRRYPTFAVSVVLTLALGIGANAAIYTIIDASLLRPPPYPNAQRLAAVSAELENGFRIPSFRMATARTIQRSVDLPITAHTPRSGARTDLDIPQTLAMHSFDPSVFETLGIMTAVGRPFTQNDVAAQVEPVVIISHRYWQSAFGMDPGAVGQVMRIDDVPFRIIGVLPAGLKFPRYSRADAWLPIDEAGVVPGTSHPETSVSLVTLMAETEGIERAGTRFDNALSGMLERGAVSGITGLHLQSVSDDRLNPDSRTALWVLAGACAFMWLIAVVNGTNLFLVRNAVRVTELRIRLSLGAGRGRIARQIVTEAILLALISGTVSALATAFTLDALVAKLPSEIASFSPNVIAISDRVVWFVFGMAALTGLLFGTIPAIAAVREARSGSIGQSLSRATTSRGAAAVRSGLAVVQVTMAVALLVGATLLARSFAKLSSVDTGFNAEGVLTMVVDLPESRYREGVARAAFRDDVLSRLQALPGVESATEGTGLPSHTGFSFGGDSIGTDQGHWHVTSDLTWISQSRVDPSFFPMLEIDLIAGRNFGPQDRGRNDVAIIDEELARVLFGSPFAAVDRQIRRSANGSWVQIVGVVEKSLLLSPVGSPQAFGLDEEQIAYQHYLPTSEEPRGYMAFAVRTSDQSARLAPTMRQAVAAVDPLQPVNSIEWLSNEYAETIAKPRFNSFLMSVLAVVATVLTLIGVYGVLSFAVSTRTRELGIRLALGAPRARVRRLVILSGLRMTVLGAVLGVGLAIALSRFLQTLLFGTSTRDVGTYVFVGALVIGAGMIAAYVPSRRAMSVDPAHVLRSE